MRNCGHVGVWKPNLPAFGAARVQLLRVVHPTACVVRESHLDRAAEAARRPGEDHRAGDALHGQDAGHRARPRPRFEAARGRGLARQDRREARATGRSAGGGSMTPATYAKRLSAGYIQRTNEGEGVAWLGQ